MNPPFTTYFGNSPIWTLPPLKMGKKNNSFQKKFLSNKKSPPHSLGGKGTKPPMRDVIIEQLQTHSNNLLSICRRIIGVC